MIRVGLNPARNRAALSVPPGQVAELDAAAVDALIWELAGVRQAMSPERADADPGPQTRVAGGTGMRWYVEPGPEAGSVQLLLFQKGLGWVGITLDRPGIEALDTAIVKARTVKAPGR